MSLPMSAVAAAAFRCCSSSLDSIAPKKPKRKLSSAIPQMTGNLQATERAMPKDASDAVKGELSTSEIERHMQEWSKMSPEELEKLYQKYEREEAAESRVLAEDSLYQMDVSLKTKYQGGTRVFWKDVAVVPYMPEKYNGWYAVAVDGRRVQAFESRSPLVVPNEAYAHAVAREWAEQDKFLNKLNMPLTDLASGAQHVAPQAIGARIDYLLSFYANDNCYFRSEAIQDEQDKMLKPVVEWFERAFDVQVPRIVGIGHPNISHVSKNKVRDALYAMEMNPYQIVALCVVAQFTSSLLLPLAMFNRIIDPSTALRINRAEENFNISTHGEIKGYHDIREADLMVKVCASAVAWRAFADVPLAKCCELPRTVDEEDLA